ncbi:MAG: diguanylate cyclase [Gammaproteobacteria bacterium]|jgi:diguanylate cyclase (GGDEF)-like protein
MQVLVADNALHNRSRLAKILTDNGHTVIEAINDQNVLKICKNKCPELLLIDSQLSGVSGIELVRNIRQLGGSSVWNTIILMADDATEVDLKQGLSCGADDFLVKPINAFQLLYKLATAKRHQELKSDIFGMAHDLAVANRALESVNKQDIMTGVYDVNTFHKMLEVEWFKAKKNKYDIALILLNLDYFRAYNEIYGADNGDQKIKQIAKALQDALPEQYKNIARTAGETFAVLLPNGAAEFALNLANDLVKVVKELGIVHKGSPCANVLTISAGVSITEGEFNNSLDLLEAADFALYKAKHTGRNQAYFEPVKVY